MTFTIHAWKADQNIVTIRIGLAVAIDKARELERIGWQVYVTDAAGSRFMPQNFDRLPLLCLAILSADDAGTPLSSCLFFHPSCRDGVLDLVRVLARWSDL